MALPNRRLRLAAKPFLLFLAVGLPGLTALAQGPRTTIVAPSDLWVRADLAIPLGNPVLLTTCEGVGNLHEHTTTLPAAPDGSITKVREFSVNCPCEEREVTARQYIHVVPATPLPQVEAASCGPVLTVTPAMEEVPFGADAQTAADFISTAGIKVEETEHMLWRNACGLGASWVVWEAATPCGEVERHAFKRTVVPQANDFGALAGDVSSSVDLSSFDAESFGTGPLSVSIPIWSGLRPVELYRTLAAAGAGGAGTAFQRVAVGCFAGSGHPADGGAVVGTETIEVDGNIEPWLGFADEVDIHCGLPQDNWPLIRARDREVGHFGAGLEQFPIPYEETVDTVAGNCPGNFTILRHITATDADGAQATGTQTLHVTDHEAPVFHGSPAELVWDGDSWPPEGATAQAVDGCASLVELTWADSADCTQGVIHRVTTATDGCGNRATLRQIIRSPAPPETLVLAVGCNDPNALNFTGDACFETAQCLYADNTSCLGDLDENGQVTTSDLLVLLGIFGTFCD